jgi:hypothetical protein
VAACGCVWLRVAACGCVWLRVAACGCVWLRVAACGFVRLCVVSCGCFECAIRARIRDSGRCDACILCALRVIACGACCAVV